MKALNLFNRVSRNLEFLLNRYQIDWSKGEFVLIRNLVLDSLKCGGITDETYSRKHFFIVMEACFIHLNNIYDTYHSFADIENYKIISM